MSYGCIRSATFELRRLHALIGPNDSGKTTALRAVRTAAQFATSHFGPESSTAPRPFDPMLRTLGSPETSITFRYEDGIAYSIKGNEDVRESVHRDTEAVAHSHSMRAWNMLGLLAQDTKVAARAAADAPPTDDDEYVAAPSSEDE